MLPKLKKRQKTLQEELLYAADEGKTSPERSSRSFTHDFKI